MGLYPSLKGESMFSLLFVLGAALAGVSSVKAVGSTLVGAGGLVAMKENARLSREMRLGINSESEEDWEWDSFQFTKEMLPESMYKLLEQKWVLNEMEKFHLLAMVNAEMAQRGEGRFADQIRGFCSAFGVPYEVMVQFSSTLVRLNYGPLVTVSNERMADPEIRRGLEARSKS